MNNYFITLLLLILFSACKKEEGKGGNSTIEGFVVTDRYDPSFTVLLGQYPAVDLDVFIQYGDEVGVSDRVITDYNGKFSFKFLYPGDYTVFTYSEDSNIFSTNLSGQLVLKQSVHVDKKETKTLATFFRAVNN